MPFGFPGEVYEIICTRLLRVQRTMISAPDGALFRRNRDNANHVRVAPPALQQQMSGPVIMQRTPGRETTRTNMGQQVYVDTRAYDTPKDC